MKPGILHFRDAAGKMFVLALSNIAFLNYNPPSPATGSAALLVVIFVGGHRLDFGHPDAERLWVLIVDALASRE